MPHPLAGSGPNRDLNAGHPDWGASRPVCREARHAQVWSRVGNPVPPSVRDMAGGFGGGAIIAFAAVLWLLYLAPTWMRRRQYLTTERTAVRLQQTLRILAETAEVPGGVLRRFREGAVPPDAARVPEADQELARTPFP